jgi:hypothetical protein
MHTGSSPIEAEPPAGMRFCNLQPLGFGLGSGYEVQGNTMNVYIIYCINERTLRDFGFWTV